MSEWWQAPPRPEHPYLLDDGMHVLVGFVRVRDGEEWVDERPWLEPPECLDIPEDAVALMVAGRFNSQVEFWELQEDG